MKQYSYRPDQLPNKNTSKFMSFVGDGKKVLEVGCAMGFQTRALKEQQACSVVGIEIDPLQAMHSRPYCEQLIVGDVETLNLDEYLGHSKFDVITFADVLEHLRNPVAALAKIKPFLNDSGFVVASIPNIAHCSVIFDMAQGKFDYRPFGLLDDTHIRFFTKKNIFDTFEKAGFLIIALDRDRLKPVETEFKTVAISTEDKAFLDYVYRMNPEADTYQFIVKASTLDGQSIPHQAELVAARDKIQLLEASLLSTQARIRSLESDVAWMERKPSEKLKNLFSKLFRPK